MEITEKNIKMWSIIGPRATVGLAALDLAKNIKNLMVLTCDVSTSAGLDRYRKTFPEKYLDLGIAEQNMIGVAAGLASENFKVITTTFAPFQTMRCCEQIKVNLGYMKQKVCMIGIASGLVLGNLGYTHCCIEDIGILRSIPNLTIISPADSLETVKAIESALNHNQSVYIRITGSANNPMVYKKDYSIFDLKISTKGMKKTFIRRIKLNLIGTHNVLNSVSAIALCLHIGISVNVIKNTLKKFTGIERRLTKVFQIKKREFFDDYAHHPTEIKSVLNGVRTTYGNRKIISVFQPHRYSRLKFLKQDFASSFKDSNLVILCPVYPAGEKIDTNYSTINFAKLITKNSKVQVITINNEQDLRKFFIKNLINDELIICMGAGSISKWIREMVL